jgi:hypothetical protein
VGDGQKPTKYRLLAFSSPLLVAVNSSNNRLAHALMTAAWENVGAGAWYGISTLTSPILSDTAPY